jgi:hypothetical protein
MFILAVSNGWKEGHDGIITCHKEKRDIDMDSIGPLLVDHTRLLQNE